MNKYFKHVMTVGLAAFVSIATSAEVLQAGDSKSGTPVLLEGNFMVADAMNSPFATSGDPEAPLPTAGGPGRVIEINVFTGERGITLVDPFGSINNGSAICDSNGMQVASRGQENDDDNQRGYRRGEAWHFACPGPWKPTGLLFGGENGHAYITSAGQHGMTEFTRDGTPIRSLHYNYPDQYGHTIAQTEVGPAGPTGTFGNAPRPLGTLFLPNGLIAQSVCDGNFSDAANSDPIQPGEIDPVGTGNSSNLYFPPVYSTPRQDANSRILIIDPDNMKVVDEITQPGRPGERKHDLWGCMAGMVAGDGALWMSTFHKAAVFKIDWRSAVQNAGSDSQYNRAGDFVYNNPRNKAPVMGIVDLMESAEPGAPPVPANDPRRRDSLRAISLDGFGTLYAAHRARSRDCLRGEFPGAPGGCNPGVFRHRVDIVPPGEDHPTRSVALDPGVNIIAGIRINRMSGPGCDFVRQETLNSSGQLNGDECDVETLYVSASAVNPGCETTGGNPANPCFIPGGRIIEYRIDAEHSDDLTNCSGDPVDGPVSAKRRNGGCALPIATFRTINPETGLEENLDPRMLMAIHEPFMQ